MTLIPKFLIGEQPYISEGTTKEYLIKVDKVMNPKTQLPLYKAAPTLEPINIAQVQPSRRVYIETYGCQMNVSDSELMSGILTQNGYEMVNRLEDANVVLLNTCAIRETAEEKVLNRLIHLHHRKRRQSDLVARRVWLHGTTHEDKTDRCRSLCGFCIGTRRLPESAKGNQFRNDR